MKKPILVVLAAGMGSRYGGVKQMEAFGKHGEMLLDYSVFDALRGGFGKIVFVIRGDLEKDFRETVLARMEGKVNYELAFQGLDSFIPPAILEHVKETGRTKPWGTAHALICAADKVDAPFAVINADDFYGREALSVMGEFLSNPGLKEGAMVPYKLEPTLSDTGTVSRGVCEIAGDYLVSIEELKAIEKKDGVIFNTGPDGIKRELEPNCPVSMNFFGFPSEIMQKFIQHFEEFIASQGMEHNAEYYLPKASDLFIKTGFIKMRALKANSRWFGITYKEDRELAVKSLASLTSSGVYPEQLWK